MDHIIRMVKVLAQTISAVTLRIILLDMSFVYDVCSEYFVSPILY
jgi:hypothetical protein